MHSRAKHNLDGWFLPCLLNCSVQNSFWRNTGTFCWVGYKDQLQPEPNSVWAKEWVKKNSVQTKGSADLLWQSVSSKLLRSRVGVRQAVKNGDKWLDCEKGEAGSQIEVGPQIALSDGVNLPIISNSVSFDIKITFCNLSPSDRLPSVLMEFLGFLQLWVRVGEGNQDQDRHQASVQWRGEAISSAVFLPGFYTLLNCVFVCIESFNLKPL